MSIKQLFESQLLSEENKQVLQEAFDAAVASKADELKAASEVELAEHKREVMTNAVVIIEESVAEHLEAISEEIKHARTLEVQYAEKLQAFKEDYAVAQEEKTTIQIQEAVAAQVEELQEGIELAKKHQFAMSIVESFGDTYKKLFVKEDEAPLLDRLSEAEAKLDKYERKEKLDEMLSIFTGRKRVIAESIFESVSTDKLEAKFESIKDLLLDQKVKETADEVVTESEKGEAEAVVVVMENQEPAEAEVETKPTISEAAQRQIERALRY